MTRRNLVRDWRNGRDRFESHGPFWNGQGTSNKPADEDGHEAHSEVALSERYEEEVETAKPAFPGTWSEDGIFRGPYTPEEELAMCQFAIAMQKRDGQLRHNHWIEFAQVVSASGSQGQSVGRIG